MRKGQARWPLWPQQRGAGEGQTGRASWALEKGGPWEGFGRELTWGRVGLQGGEEVGMQGMSCPRPEVVE